jgi:hypothetical protein
MTRTEILARYRRLRQISKEQHEAVLDIIAPNVLLDWARRLDLTEGKAIVLENDNEMMLPEDLAIYLPRPGRSHPLDRYARVAPGSDEAIVLAAMRRARFSLWRIERRHSTTGLILRDLLRGEETWLVDEAMEKNAPPGMEMAARLLQPESFAMTARIIVPILPDLMTLPELMEEVFTKASALRRLQGNALVHPAGDPNPLWVILMPPGSRVSVSRTVSPLPARCTSRGPALRNRLLSRRCGYGSDGSRPLPKQIAQLYADGCMSTAHRKAPKSR